MINMETIFYMCVEVLMWIAVLFGCTYEEINVIIFCIIGPIVFFGTVAYAYILNRKINKLTQ